MKLHPARLRAAWISAALAITASAQEAPNGDVERGREAYADYGCWQCHGTTGAGGGWQGPKIAPTPIPYAAFAYQIRTPRAIMPHYAAQLLSDAQVADIYAYLRSIPVGRSAEEIELLR